MMDILPPIVVGPDFIKAMAAEQGITPAEFVANAGDHVMTPIPTDNEGGFVVVPLKTCKWNGK